MALVGNTIGLVWNLYDRIWWFDEVAHAYTTFAFTLPLTLWLYNVVLTGAHKQRFLFVLVVATLGLGIGAAWEVAEWAYDQMVSGDMILGKLDTITDLILDTGGALVAGWLAARMVQP